MKLTKALEKRVRKAVEEAKDTHEIRIRHCGRDYYIVFNEETDGKKIYWTGEVSIYQHCETDIRETLIEKIKI